MKKTCYNCIHRCDLCKAEDVQNYIEDLKTYTNNDIYHMHDFCDAWNTFLNAYHLLDRRLSTHFLPDDEILYNDLETGEACCYMYEPRSTPFKDDSWFEANYNHMQKLLNEASILINEEE